MALPLAFPFMQRVVLVGVAMVCQKLELQPSSTTPLRVCVLCGIQATFQWIMTWLLGEVVERREELRVKEEPLALGNPRKRGHQGSFQKTRCPNRPPWTFCRLMISSSWGLSAETWNTWNQSYASLNLSVWKAPDWGHPFRLTVRALRPVSLLWTTSFADRAWDFSVNCVAVAARIWPSLKKMRSRRKARFGHWWDNTGS